MNEKASEIWREKQEYDNALAGLNQELETIKTDIKGLFAKRREIEAVVRRKKDRQNDVTHEQQLISEKSQAKWDDGRSAKRDVDEAARNRRSLQKQLKEARLQEDLFHQYPDAGLRAFARHALQSETHSKLFSPFDVKLGMMISMLWRPCWKTRRMVQRTISSLKASHYEVNTKK